MLKTKYLVSYISTLLLLLTICINYIFVSQLQLNNGFANIPSTSSHSIIDILKDQIQYMKYDISKLYDDTTFHGFTNPDIIPTSSLLPTYNFKSILESKSYIQNRKPIVFRTPEVSNWKALQWDVWVLAYKWPLLHNLLELKVHSSHRQEQQQQEKQQQDQKKQDQQQNGYNDKEKEIKSSYFPLFVLENQPIYGEVIDDDISTTNHFSSHPELVEELLFLDFLIHERMSIHTNSNESISKYFYSTNYAVMEHIANLTHDIDYKSLIYDEGFSSLETNITAYSIPPTLHLLSANCGLQTRYSPYHTMKTQLIGKTKYFLFSPKQMKYLYIYPSIHASEKQSQINLYEFNNRNFSNRNFNNRNGTNHNHNRNNRNRKDENNTYSYIQQHLKGYTTHHLIPGETLYIPPYWFVLMENGPVFSMVLETTSPSREQVVLMEAYAMALPFRSNGVDINDTVSNHTTNGTNIPIANNTTTTNAVSANTANTATTITTATISSCDNDTSNNTNRTYNTTDNNNINNTTPTAPTTITTTTTTNTNTNTTTATTQTDTTDTTTTTTTTTMTDTNTASTIRWLTNMTHLTLPERVVLSQIYLVHILSRVHGIASIHKYIQSVYRTRYQFQLFPEEALSRRRNKLKLHHHQHQQQQEKKEKKKKEEEEQQVHQSSENANDSNGDDMMESFDCLRNNRPLAQDIADSLDKAYLIQGARFIAQHVNNPIFSNSTASGTTTTTNNTRTDTSGSSGSSGVQWIWLGDYIEQIARWAMMQNPNHAVLFLTQCFDDAIVTKIDISHEEMVEGPSVLKIGSEHYSDVEELKDMIRKDHHHHHHHHH